MTSARKSSSRLSAKLSAAKRSFTAWFSVSVPIVLAAAEALKDNLGSLDEYLNGWGKVAAACVVSAIVVALRVRAAGKSED
jgi:hypothetical protein